MNKKIDGIEDEETKELLKKFDISKALSACSKKDDKKVQSKRVVDLYNRKDLEQHMQRYAQHCAAKRVNPTFAVLLDWLYSMKRPDEKDEFIRIERIIEMIKDNQVYPLLILEVLEYALKVEKAAIGVVDEFGEDEAVGESKSITELKNALNVRLEVREMEKEDEKNDENNSTENKGMELMNNFISKLKGEND